jgi:hypothetical protein
MSDYFARTLSRSVPGAELRPRERPDERLSVTAPEAEDLSADPVEPVVPAYPTARAVEPLAEPPAAAVAPAEEQAPSVLDPPIRSDGEYLPPSVTDDWPAGLVRTRIEVTPPEDDVVADPHEQVGATPEPRQRRLLPPGPRDDPVADPIVSPVELSWPEAPGAALDTAADPSREEPDSSEDRLAAALALADAVLLDRSASAGPVPPPEMPVDDAGRAGAATPTVVVDRLTIEIVEDRSEPAPPPQQTSARPQGLLRSHSGSGWGW